MERGFPAVQARHRRLIVFVAALLFAAFAVTWPLVEVGPTGPVLVTLTHAHGVDARDLFATVPLALAVALVVKARRCGPTETRESVGDITTSATPRGRESR